MKIKSNVLQHQFSITIAGSSEQYIATKGICICTGWYGWDRKTGIHFLCHFDSPLSTRSMPFFLDKLRDELAQVCGEDHRFNSILVGGKSWWWSKWTRSKIRLYIEEQSDLNIHVKDGPYDFGCSSRDLVLSNKFRRITGATISGKSHPNGLLWFFKSMKDARPE